MILRAIDIQKAISVGASSFLRTQYLYLSLFVLGFSFVIFFLLAAEDGVKNIFHVAWDRQSGDKLPSFWNGLFSTIAFLAGAGTSILSGYLGMRIATFANARTTAEARKGIAPAFMCAFRSGAVMGFLLPGMGLLMAYLAIVLFRLYYGSSWDYLFEAIAGYGLGGSSVALFGRVGGGIYTKAADVGADLAGKVEESIPEDDPRNPAVIADNVGDIAGMGADLFGSFAEATCAALVVSSFATYASRIDCEDDCEHSWLAMLYPLLISAFGIFVCLITTFAATDLWPARKSSEIEDVLKMQLIISSLLMTPVIYGVTAMALPAEFDLPHPGSGGMKTIRNWYMFICVAAGLWSGLIIGISTEYYTSNRYRGVQDVADSCRTGAATNVIFGLALGYKSAIVPCLMIAICIYVSFTLAGMFGIACAALGMLSILPSCLGIDAYGPISDNAGGIAEMSGMSPEIRERTDALDAAGNTTAAIGKGFAIGSAALVSLALFGAFVTRAGIDVADASILNARVFSGLLVGAMLPYWFSSLTMKSVGKAALAMVSEVREQFRTNGIMEGEGEPNYSRCVEISTHASLTAMIPPGALVLLTPIAVGVLFGTHMLAGVLVGALVSGVQMAVSMSNTGGAWDNAKKYLEAGACEHAKDIGGKGSEAHKAAVIGDTVGDPLKDTSGPSLNILVKLMAVESLVFAPFFASEALKGGLIFQIFS
ncbi:unnamed protein product [Ostreobium quekettii]|uniref:H(+)-exporting diphosphatase n=1 Tax=Ostreobium quekettii TaxID=121088 RepID=A0A8S1J087_9CHLO|nr:unnamed protein product [Ostreobium quekettii]